MNLGRTDKRSFVEGLVEKEGDWGIDPLDENGDYLEVISKPDVERAYKEILDAFLGLKPHLQKSEGIDIKKEGLEHQLRGEDRPKVETSVNWTYSPTIGERVWYGESEATFEGMRILFKDGSNGSEEVHLFPEGEEIEEILICCLDQEPGEVLNYNGRQEFVEKKKNEIRTNKLGPKVLAKRLNSLSNEKEDYVSTLKGFYDTIELMRRKTKEQAIIKEKKHELEKELQELLPEFAKLSRGEKNPTDYWEETEEVVSDLLELKDSVDLRKMVEENFSLTNLFKKMLGFFAEYLNKKKEFDKGIGEASEIGPEEIHNLKEEL